MHPCFKKLVGIRDATHAYIPPDSWSANGHNRWYPGADGPGYYELYTPAPPETTTIMRPLMLYHHRRIDTCPTCGERLEV